MYKACIFDLDGTLTDTLESLTYSVNTTLRELGLGQITPTQCKEFVGSGARRLIEQSIQATGDPEASRIEEAMEAYGRIFKVHCTYHVAPYDGIVGMLQELKKEGVQLAVLSNKPHLQTQDVVATFFEEGTFARVYGQQEGVPRKPDPAAVHMVLEELGVSEKECLYIGDSDVDMLTGCAAGVPAVGVTWGFRSKEVLMEHGATYIVDKPQEIVSIVKE
ncbi:MAG: HAD family hydrolase [Tyzzerella sp.]|nr:HAD family hydrolase [Tyzzerella sp.]